MRTNLSEELEINDDIKLDDGSESKEEVEKEAEKLEKEIQKDLDDKVKMATDLEDTPKPELNNGMGKSLKVKQFTERLTLEEPTNQINEDLEDEIFEQRSDVTYAIYNTLIPYIRKLREAGKSKDEILDDCETVCDEVLYHLEDDDAIMEY